MKRLCRFGFVALLFSSCVCSSPAPEVTKSKASIRAATDEGEPESAPKVKPQITMEKLRTAIDQSNTPAQQAAVEAEALYRIPVEENFTSLASNKINERTNLNAELDRLQEAIESGTPQAADPAPGQ